MGSGYPVADLAGQIHDSPRIVLAVAALTGFEAGIFAGYRLGGRPVECSGGPALGVPCPRAASVTACAVDGGGEAADQGDAPCEVLAVALAAVGLLRRSPVFGQPSFGMTFGEVKEYVLVLLAAAEGQQGHRKQNDECLSQR